MSYWSNPETAAAYLSAMIDGEGTVRIPDNKNCHRAIHIANTDIALISACVKCCETLGIRVMVRKHPYGKYGRKQCWRVNISGRENIQRAAEVLQLQAPKKAERLKEAAGNYLYGPPCSKERLFVLYHVEQLSVADIARQFERSTESIFHWMKNYDIQKRSRSESNKLVWRKRKCVPT